MRCALNCCASVLHADETPVAMLKPGHGKTHRAYLWSYCTTAYNDAKAVVFDFADSRGGQHVRDFLGLPGRRQARLAAAAWCATTSAATRPASSWA
jgi:hypothetical protein